MEVESEYKRLDDALETSSQDLKHVEQTALNDSRLVDSAALLSVHSAMANEIAALVKQRGAFAAFGYDIRAVRSTINT